MSSYQPLSPTTEANEFAHVRNVAVVGAGVAGLQMARTLLAHNLKVTVFEKAPGVGGLWRENYASYGVQVPKQLYEFPDFPFSAVQFGDYPTGAQTKAYIESYAKHFNLLPYIKVSTEVLSLLPRPHGLKGWLVKSKHARGQEEEEAFDFVVVASGMYSAVPNMPELEGLSSFGGEVIHSSKYLDQGLAKGKRVVVIGSGKSAIDIVVNASEVSQVPPTLLFRNAHWCTPRLIAGLIPFQYVFLSRFGQALVSWYKGSWPAGAPCICTLLSWLLFPLMWLAFRVVELLFKIQRGQWGEYAPKLDVVADFYGFAHVLDTTFLRKWSAGALQGKLGSVKKLGPKKIEVDSGDTIDADLIVCATGFCKTYDYMPAETRQALQIESDGLYLYRHILPADVRTLSLAFCGSECATISNISTHGLHAEYIARTLAGRIALPSEAEMRAECDRTKAWKRRWMPETSSRASLVLLHQTHYHDQLLRDMGENPSRKCWFLSEIFCPYGPADYAGVISQGPNKESA